MIDQTIIVKPILEGFKKMKITAGEIEIELGLSPGYLSKVKNGVRSLEELNLNKLIEIYKERAAQKKETPTPIFIVEPSVKSYINVAKKEPSVKMIELTPPATVKIPVIKKMGLMEQLSLKIREAELKEKIK